MTQNSPPSSSTSERAATTETFQKHYGRGPGYPDDDHYHHRGHPPSQESYPPSHHYAAPGQHPPPPLPPPPPGHRGGPPPPAHGYHHPSWYYPPHNATAAASANPSSGMAAASSSSSTGRSSSRAVKKLNNVPPNLVTPKSQDSETLIPIAADTNKAATKKPTAKSTNKKANSSKKKESSHKMSSSNNDKEPEMEEEPKVEPMKQDFHFYAMDHYEEVKQVCQQQLDNSFADGSISEKNKETNQLFLLTTLLNARLIQNWEEAPASTRAEYLKKEEADRKRFMSEEEVASRHCATLTARRRSPKQSGVLGRAGSFGLNSNVEVPSLTAQSEGSTKRPYGEVADADVPVGAAKRVKV